MSVMNSKLRSVVLGASVVALMAAVGCGGLEPEAEQGLEQLGAVLPVEQGLDDQLAQPRLDDLLPRGELRVRDRLDPTEQRRQPVQRELVDRTFPRRTGDEEALQRNEEAQPETLQGRVEPSESDGLRQGRFAKLPKVDWDQVPQPEVVPYRPRVEVPEGGALDDLPPRLEGEMQPVPTPKQPTHRFPEDDTDDDGASDGDNGRGA